MNDNVVITKWPSLDTYHNVFFGGKIVGAVNSEHFNFIAYPPYGDLLDCDKELVNEHVDEFICVLQITHRITS